MSASLRTAATIQLRRSHTPPARQKNPQWRARRLRPSPSPNLITCAGQATHNILRGGDTTTPERNLPGEHRRSQVRSQTDCDILDAAIEAGVVSQSGGYFRYDDEMIGHGRENAKQFLAGHPELFTELRSLVLGQEPEEQEGEA